MPDYRIHRMKDWAWCDTYRARLGREAYDRYVNAVYRLLTEMKPGSFFVVEKNVKPDNIDLFIKICCMFIQEHAVIQKKCPECYEFNEDYTIIKRKIRYDHNRRHLPHDKRRS